TLKELISQTMVRWSQEDQIQDPELVRIMYTLLRRQYDSIGELLQALRKAYTISAASVKDTINLLAALGQIRSLLSVRMGKEEELLMINGLGIEISPNVQSKPPLLQLEAISSHPITCYLGEETNPHLTTTSFQVLVESDKVSPQPPPLQAEQPWCPQPLLTTPVLQTPPQLRCPSLDTLQHLDVCLVVVTYLAGCGLQSCPVLLAKGYPDIGWNPIEGERYLSFLRFAVFVN
ncbi:Ryanodine receptor 3, partial [Leptosomus discolor]